MIFVAMMCVFVAIVAFAFLVAAAIDSRNGRELREMAQRLDGEPDTNHSFAINRGGHHAKLWRARRPVGKTSVPWTEIDVQIPRVYPLVIYLRKQRSSDSGPIQRGETIDVEVGDSQFDAAFLVEAAPEVVIKKLLDADVRTYLLEQRARGEVELMTKDRSGERVLQLAIKDWIQEAEAKRAIAITIAIASRIREAFTEAVEEVPLEQIGTPFRETPDDHAQRIVESSHRSEVDAIEDLHAKRLANEKWTAFAIIIGCLLFTFLVALAVHR